MKNIRIRNKSMKKRKKMDLVRSAKIFVSSGLNRIAKSAFYMEIVRTSGARGTESRKSAYANAQKGINGDLKNREKDVKR